MKFRSRNIESPATVPAQKGLIQSDLCLILRIKQSNPLYDDMNAAMKAANEIVSRPASFNINRGFLNKWPINKLGTNPSAYLSPNVIRNDRKTERKQFSLQVSLCLQNRFLDLSSALFAKLSLI